MMSPIGRECFEQLHSDGLAASKAGNHEQALDSFERAGRVANAYEDRHKLIHAMTPAARALWSMGRYDEATEKLEHCATLAERLRLRDEQGITISNLGRIAAHRILHTEGVENTEAALRGEAVPRFAEAYEILKGHPHLYYRYANAQHGSIISAYAGERSLAATLIAEGLRVAPRVSAEPYDRVRTYTINRGGIVQMLTAALLLPAGGRTPVIANMSKARLIR